MNVATATAASTSARAGRVFWIGFGVATHALFGVTLYFLFFYLRGSDAPHAANSLSESRRAALVDSILALQFGVSHSWLLLPRTRERLTRLIPGAAYGVFFCACTCVSLLLTFFFWQPIGGALWNLQESARTAMVAAFYGAWIALFYSLYLSGMGYQTGWSTWWPWVHGMSAPPRKFQPRSWFLWIRHPVYLSVMALLWLTPVMTYDRVVLGVWWSLYIFVGSYLKDRRLLRYIGEPYREYQSRVPGYPLLVGPLGRVGVRSAS